MPVVGFLGFPPFAVECWAMYVFCRSLLTPSVVNRVSVPVPRSLTQTSRRAADPTVRASCPAVFRLQALRAAERKE